MCAKGTPVRTRLFCTCSHALLAGTLIVLVLVVAWVWAHLLLLLGMAGLVFAVTFAAVWWLMRFTQPVIQRPVPSRAAAGPSAGDVLEAAEAITRAAVPGRAVEPERR